MPPKRKARQQAQNVSGREAPPKKVKSSSSPTTDSITLDQFKDALGRYSGVVSEKLYDLDKKRYDVIPKSVASRKPKSLTHEELVTLVEWKLKHGTFRPALLGMAKQHKAEEIVDITTKAFQMDPADGLKTVTTLRGIGPATGSLLLSCADASVPFFSDELYRWMMLDEDGKGWDRKIGYTVKEYSALVEKVKGFLKQHGDWGNASDLEKVAYVLGRG